MRSQTETLVCVRGSDLADPQRLKLRAHLAARRVRRLTIEREAGEEAVVTLIRLLALEPEELIAEAAGRRPPGARGVCITRSPRRQPGHP